MSRSIDFGRGSKRKVRKIRFSQKDRMSLIVLALLLILAVFVGGWLGAHHID